MGRESTVYDVLSFVTIDASRRHKFGVNPMVICTGGVFVHSLDQSMEQDSRSTLFSFMNNHRGDW